MGYGKCWRDSNLYLHSIDITCIYIPLIFFCFCVGPLPCKCHLGLNCSQGSVWLSWVSVRPLSLFLVTQICIFKQTFERRILGQQQHVRITSWNVVSESSKEMVTSVLNFDLPMEFGWTVCVGGGGGGSVKRGWSDLGRWSVFTLLPPSGALWGRAGPRNTRPEFRDGQGFLSGGQISRSLTHTWQWARC